MKPAGFRHLLFIAFVPLMALCFPRSTLAQSAPLAPPQLDQLVQRIVVQLVGATLDAKGGGPVPSEVKAGQTVTVIVHTQTLEGEGALQWAPVGKKDLVGWIYQLELD